MVERQQRARPHAAESLERQRDQSVLHQQLRLAANEQPGPVRQDGGQRVLHQPDDPEKSAAASVSADVRG